MSRVVIWGGEEYGGSSSAWRITSLRPPITSSGARHTYAERGNDQGLTMERIVEAADAVLVENTPISDNCVKQVQKSKSGLPMPLLLV